LGSNGGDGDERKSNCGHEVAGHTKPLLDHDRFVTLLFVVVVRGRESEEKEKEEQEEEEREEGMSIDWVVKVNGQGGGQEKS